MKRSNLSHTLFLLMAILGFIGILGTAYMWGTLEYYRFKGETDQLRKTHLAEQKQKVINKTTSALNYILFKKDLAEKSLKAEIKQRTYEAHDTATYIYNKNSEKKSKEEIEGLIHDALFAASWNNGKGYYFAEDMKGTELINRNNPELEGTNIWDLQDSKGVYIMRRIIEVAKSEEREGFCSYHWNKPGHPGVLLPKFSFVKYFKPLDWVIGNGKYLKDKEEEIKQEILEYFEKTRSGEDGYIFIGTYDGISLSYPAQNQNVIDITDVNGKKIVQEIIQKAKQGGGFVSYVMPKLGNEKEANKISYCLGIDDWQWYIGYGVYTDRIEKIISQKEADLRDKIIARSIKSILLLFVLLLLSIFFARFVAKKASFDFKAFSGFFENAADHSVRIPEERIHFKEFETLAKSANQMIEERQKYNLEKEQMQKQLEMAQKMEAIGMMAGGVAHDLNNTLAAMINIPEFILSEMKEDDPNKESIEMILDAGKRASAIVQDLLTIGRGVVRKTAIADLNHLIKKSIDSVEFKELIKNYPKIKLSTHFADEQLLIDCSIAHINKLLYNLVCNGMEAISEKGELEIKTSLFSTDKTISGVNNVPPGKYILLEVVDNGIGLSPEELEKIFEPFYTKKSMGRSGTGLGLAVVWNTVVDHNAFIQTRSDSSGTSFSIYFPTNDQYEPDINTTQSARSKERGNRQNILIVDDEKIQHLISTKILEKAGYRCHSVTSGEEALEYLKNHQADLILLDMMLGKGMNGKKTFQEILKINPGQKAFVVTGFAKNEDVEATIEMGALGCLHKPYSGNELEETVYKSFQST